MRNQITKTILNNRTEYRNSLDQLHREDGPAMEFVDGTKRWYLNGELHREDGPAVEYVDGSERWYLEGENYSSSEYRIKMHGKKHMFYLFRKQDSDGCDYSINCGEELILLNAKTKEEAIKEIIGVPDCWKDFAASEDEFHDFLCDCGIKSHLEVQNERRLKKCILLEIVEETNMFPFLQEKMNEINDYIAELKSKKHVDTERLEYERLKKKFDK